MAKPRLPLWKVLTRAGILLGLAMLTAGFVVRDIRARGFLQTGYIEWGLWIAGGILAAGGTALNYRMFVDLLRRRRTAEGLNFLTAVALAVALAGLLCYISTRRFTRMDWTARGKYQLDTKTRNILRALDRDIEVTVVSSGREEPVVAYAVDTAAEMIEEFKSLSGHITLQTLRWTEQEGQERLQKLLQQLDEDNVPQVCLILATDESHEIIPHAKFLRTVPTPTGPRYSFAGEDVLASTLIKLTEGEKATVYALTGHGERPLEAQAPRPGEQAEGGVMADPRFSLSRLVKALAKDNYEVRPLNLAAEGTVPDDCAALIIAGPRAPFAEAEIKELRDYFDSRNGAAVIMIDPEAVSGGPANLAGLLAEYGVRVHTDTVAIVTQDLGPFGVAQSPGVPVVGEGFAEHPITRDLNSFNVLMEWACVLEPGDAAPGKTVQAQALLTGIESSWGERNYPPPQRSLVQYQPEQDLPPPLVLAAVVGPRAPAGGLAALDSKLPGPRIVVFGSSVPFLNSSVMQFPAHLYIVQNSINWMAGKMHMLGIPPKSLDLSIVTVSNSRVVAGRYIFIAILPACVIVLGIGVWLLRRR